MNRRTFLAVAAGSGLAAAAGCVGPFGGGPSDVDTEFELVDAELPVDDPPAVEFDGDTVIVRGTVQYGSSSCGTVELAHAAFEDSQDRLDLLVVAADDSGVFGGCTDDLVETGYRVEATAERRPRRVAATEHHVFGDVYSTTAEPDEQ